MAAGKKESLFDKKEASSMKNVEDPKTEGGEKPAPSGERTKSGTESKSGDTPTPRDEGASVGERHTAEREAMHKSHEGERRDLHMNHREEHRRMHGRHEAAHKAMMERHAAELQAAATAGPEMGSSGPAGGGTEAPTGTAA